MTVKEFLKSEQSVNLTEIAKRMWPGNSNAKTYLSRKLNDKLPWTEKDTTNALNVLRDLSIKIQNIEA